jgi:HAE1 family hydrophobic/amphiphilic exporter-1
MWLTRVSILRPVTITMVVVGILVLGLFSLRQLPVDLYPDIEFPWVTVISVYPGAGPEEIETLVTKPIEDAVSTISGVKNVVSSSEEGVSSVSVEFYLGTNLDTASNDVREKVDAAGFQLPRDMDPPVIEKFSMSAIPVIAFALSSPRPPQELRRIADDIIKDRIGKLRGVGAVRVAGGDVREILVAVDKAQMEAYGLTINQIVLALQAANLNLPSGTVEEGPREYAVRAVGEFASVDEISDVQVRTPRGATVCLSNLAEVADTVAERRSYTRVDGEDSVAITVLKQSDANTVSVADAVREELTALTGQTFDERGYEVKDATRARGILPADIIARITDDQSTFIRDSLHDLRNHMFFGALLAVLVVFLFLHNFRGTIIVALAIPTSIIATFTPMLFAGFTLNQMTMLGLSLSVGVLVDDSIVVIENIYRHLQMGEPPKEAALNGRTEIGLAAITITLVDVVVFVPIAFMGGMIGMFFREFGITVAIATLFSLFVSFTLTPMLSSRWYRRRERLPGSEDTDPAPSAIEPPDTSKPQFPLFAMVNAPFRLLFASFDRSYSALERFYRGVLAWALDHRLATILIGIISLLAIVGITVSHPGKPPFLIIIAVLALLGLIAGGRGSRVALLVVAIAGMICVQGLYRQLGGEFFPRVDQGMVSVTVELPAGSSLDSTDSVVRQLEQFLLDGERFPEVESIYATVGAGLGGVFGGGGQGASYGGVRVVLVDQLERERSDQDIVTAIEDFSRTVPGATIKATAYQGMGGGGGAPVNIELSGSEMSEILRVAQAVRYEVAAVPGTLNPDITWKVGKPEVRADIDPYRAADRGVTTFQVASALRTSLEGDTSTKYREGSYQYDIRVRLDEVDRQSVDAISDIMVGYATGPTYLADVASVGSAGGPTKIDRKNRQRMVAVQADLQPGYPSQNVVNQIGDRIKDIDSGDVSIHFGGETEMFVESMQRAVAALILSIILVYIIQAALFEGYLSPFIIMFALPMALVGALLAIVLTGKTLSIVTMIGIIMLMGLVGKNAILLVDYTNTLRARGLSIREAILEAGPVRLRPILMTALSLIFGMLPIALATARGGEFRSPMAIAVIGGMAVSTLLSLLIIPVLYTLFDGLATWLNQRIQAILGRTFS